MWGAHATEAHRPPAPKADDASDPARALEEIPSPARLEGFSDGVFAIIITLLVLDLRVPREGALRQLPLGEALLRNWPAYVGFVLSFLQVGVLWANHHTMFHYIRRADHLLKAFTLLFLLAVAALPFTTALLAEYVRGDESDSRLAALLYAGAMGVSGLFFNAAWWHARRAGLVDGRADPSRLHALGLHWLLAPLCYAVAFALALVSVRVSIAMYVLLLVYYALPGPAVVRRLTARRSRTARSR